MITSNVFVSSVPIFNTHTEILSKLLALVVHGVKGCGQRKLSVCVVEPPAHVRVPRQRSLAPSVTSVTLVANDKGDNEVILGPVPRSPGICLTAEENPRKPQVGERLMKVLCDQSSPQMGSLSSK